MSNPQDYGIHEGGKAKPAPLMKGACDRMIGGTLSNYKGTGAGIRILLYSHDTLGLGHLNRNLKIARALIARYPGLSILLVTGSPQAYRYRFPAGVDFVKLPAVHKIADEKYESRFLDIPFKQTLDLRTRMILDTTKVFAPHLLLVDHAPLGLKAEILPALKWLRKNKSDSITILGMRDILDDPPKIIKLWKRQRIYEVLRDLYDHILIYGMATIFDPISSYAFPDEVRAKSRFCGYIADPDNGSRPSPKENTVGKDDEKFVVVTIGGGDGGGETIISNYLRFLREYRSSIFFKSLILTGPFLPPELWSRFQNEARNLRVRILGHVSTTRPFLVRSDLVISTVGYNTITDILSYATRSLAIPRIMYRKEQLLRAMKLSDMRLLTLLHPDDVTPKRLYESVVTLLNNDDNALADARSRKLIQLDGVQRLAEFLGELFEKIETKRERPHGK